MPGRKLSSKSRYLKIQVHALRRALGDGEGGHRYVVTIPGRGYNFVAPVNRDESSPVALPLTVASAATHNLPDAVTRIIGREEAVAAITSRLSRGRLVTVVGAGGIGKTTLALAVAEQMIPAYAHGVWRVDLTPLADPRLVAGTVAAGLAWKSTPKTPSGAERSPQRQACAPAAR